MFLPESTIRFFSKAKLCELNFGFALASGKDKRKPST